MIADLVAGPWDKCACGHSRHLHNYAGESCNQLHCQCAGFRWPDLSGFPDDAITSEYQRRRQAKRITRRGGRDGGRPCVPTACPRCGALCPSRREAKAHCRK